MPKEDTFAPVLKAETFQFLNANGLGLLPPRGQALQQKTRICFHKAKEKNNPCPQLLFKVRLHIVISAEYLLKPKQEICLMSFNYWMSLWNRRQMAGDVIYVTSWRFLFKWSFYLISFSHFLYHSCQTGLGRIYNYYLISISVYRLKFRLRYSTTTTCHFCRKKGNRTHPDRLKYHKKLFFILSWHQLVLPSSSANILKISGTSCSENLIVDDKTSGKF